MFYVMHKSDEKHFYELFEQISFAKKNVYTAWYHFYIIQIKYNYMNNDIREFSLRNSQYSRENSNIYDKVYCVEQNRYNLEYHAYYMHFS